MILFFVLYHFIPSGDFLGLENSAWVFWVLLEVLRIFGGFDFCPHAYTKRNNTQKRHPCVSLEEKKKIEGSRFKLHYIVLEQRHLSCKKRREKWLSF